MSVHTPIFFSPKNSQMGFTDRREVRQFQYTAWPDHGVPEHPAPFLQFLRRVNALNPVDAGPAVTHCSAGVGRTGAFIVVDSMLERLKHEKTVDIYGHVTCLRRGPEILSLYIGRGMKSKIDFWKLFLISYTLSSNLRNAA